MVLYVRTGFTHVNFIHAQHSWIKYFKLNLINKKICFFYFRLKFMMFSWNFYTICSRFVTNKASNLKKMWKQIKKSGNIHILGLLYIYTKQIPIKTNENAFRKLYSLWLFRSHENQLADTNYLIKLGQVLGNIWGMSRKKSILFDKYPDSCLTSIN